MSIANLPFPETGKTDKETIQNLFDTVIKLRKELEFVLQHIDESNSPALKGVIAQSNDNTASIAVTDGQIQLIVDDVADIDGRMSTAESSITQTANAITLKVSTTDYNGAVIASLINQTSGLINMSAVNINLSGYVTFNALDSELSTPGSTVINGANITTGTIDAARISTEIGQVKSLLYIGSQGSTDTKEIRFASGSRIRGGSDGVSPWLSISALDVTIGDNLIVPGSLTVSGSTNIKAKYS